MDELHHILFSEGSEAQSEQPREDRRSPGAGLGLAVILAAVFWAGVIAAIVLV
jgi:hypothetical protein